MNSYKSYSLLIIKPGMSLINIAVSILDVREKVKPILLWGGTTSIFKLIIEIQLSFF